MPALILIRGAGDLASGVAIRLHRVGLNVAMTELPKPLAVRRSVAFAEAVYAGSMEIEGISGRRVEESADALKILGVLSRQQVPVLIDPDCTAAASLHPLVIIDARMRKRPPEPFSHQARLYIGLGPGFRAPEHCHAVIETERGHTLGRVIWNGSALQDTTRPEGNAQRVLRAPVPGVLESDARISQHFEAGELIARVAGEPVLAPLRGTLRGLLRPGLTAHKGMKIGDIDPRDDPRLCALVSEKSLAVAGGVLEAMLARPEVRSALWV
jgi:xanthine dehydrogenase accessory factor